MLSRLTQWLPDWSWAGERVALGSGARGRGKRAPGTLARARVDGKVLGTQRSLEYTNAPGFDVPLMWVTALLLGLGLVMVYSASIAVLERRDPAGDLSTYFLVRQTGAIGVALIAALFAYAMPPRRWQQIAMPLFFLGVLLLVLVFVPGVGRRAGGAYRWISLGVTTIQPTEMMKLFVVLYVADYAVRKQALMPHLWRALLPMAIALSIVGLLIMRQPDLGALIVILMVAMGVLFLGGMNPKLFFGMVAFLAAVFTSFILLVPFRRARFFSYLDPFERSNAEGSSYQLTHSLMAIGKGEWLGSGLGAGVAKLNFLPEPHTDFLFATIGEELGMVGMLVVILLFFWLVRRCFEIGRQAIAFEQFFNGLVAQGVGLWIGLQVFINLGVNLGLLPTKGLTLPFMSFGGNAILMNCVAMAIVLRIDVENRKMMRGAIL
ncbi:MAG: putative lipid II flippase FtsW [Lautropia sp.]|nr:putative lipid II flippase FtsW [Lautropia sp.]